MLAKIHVTLKNGVLDTQGKAVQSALRDLGYKEVQDVRLAKYIEIRIDSASEAEARRRIKEMCEKLLANTVIETYQIAIEPSA